MRLSSVSQTVIFKTWNNILLIYHQNSITFQEIEIQSRGGAASAAWFTTKAYYDVVKGFPNQPYPFLCLIHLRNMPLDMFSPQRTINALPSANRIQTQVKHCLKETCGVQFCFTWACLALAWIRGMDSLPHQRATCETIWLILTSALDIPGIGIYSSTNPDLPMEHETILTTAPSNEV